MDKREKSTKFSSLLIGMITTVVGGVIILVVEYHSNIFVTQPKTGTPSILTAESPKNDDDIKFEPGAPIPETHSKVAAVDTNQRKCTIRVLNQGDMKVGWLSKDDGGHKLFQAARLTPPCAIDLVQGFIYRLKLTEIIGKPGLSLYPTIEIAPSDEKSISYMMNGEVPIQFDQTMLDLADSGETGIVAYYLPGGGPAREYEPEYLGELVPKNDFDRQRRAQVGHILSTRNHVREFVEKAREVYKLGQRDLALADLRSTRDIYCNEESLPVGVRINIANEIDEILQSIAKGEPVIITQSVGNLRFIRSTDQDTMADVVIEAKKRGSLLLILRLGPSNEESNFIH